MSDNRATKTFATTLGILVGLSGIEHGFFEILQGDVRPDSIMIDAIGSAHMNWEYAIETALTIIPSFLISGILAMIIGILVVIWAYAFIDRKFGAIVLLLLSVSLFLVGGGFAPIFLTILAFVAAMRINKPLNWWQLRSPAMFRRIMAILWPWSIIASVLMFLIAVEIAIFGNPLLIVFDAETTYAVQFSLGMGMLLLSIFSLPAAFAHDVQRQNNLTS